MSQPFNERQIKCRLIDALLRQFPSSIIGTEVPFLSRRRWVDVLVISRRGDLIAYEIKSGLDSLAKLEGQARDYLSTFNRLNVIVAAKYADTVRTNLPTRVGYAVFDQRTTQFKYRRRAVKQDRLAKQNLTQFLWKRDLCVTSSDHGRSVDELRARFANHNTCKVIHKRAVAALRARYGLRFRTFLEEKSQFTHIEDLEYLTKRFDSLL